MSYVSWLWSRKWHSWWPDQKIKIPINLSGSTNPLSGFQILPMVTHPHSIIHWCPSNPTNNKHMRTSRIIFTYHNHHCNPQLRHRALPKAPTKPPLPVIARRSKTLGWQNGQQRYAESSKCWMNELFSLLQYQLLFVCV